MRELPILFSTPMVQAILDNRKFMTRRVIKKQPQADIDGTIHFPWATFFNSGTVHTWDKNGVGGENWNSNSYPSEDKYTEALKRTPYENPCPYGQPGDRLWVRETWAEVSSGIIEYRAGYKEALTGLSGIDHIGNKIKWKPSIFMPKVAARIWLEVVSVRVEKLQDITKEQAEAEGIGNSFIEDCAYDGKYEDIPWNQEEGLAIHQFARLWDKINESRGFPWSANPYVWVITFKRVMLDG